LKRLRSRVSGAVAGLLIASFSGGFAHEILAAPFTPTSKSQVVEKLPARANTPELKKVARLKKQLSIQPNDSSTAFGLIEAYFDAALATGEPRYIGYARAVFEPRFPQQQGNADWWYLSGLLVQYTHQFDQAHQAFDKAIRLKPDHLASMSWKSALWMVEGKYAEAKSMCNTLQPHASALNTAGCAAFAEAGMGQLPAAYQGLKTQYEQHQAESGDGLRLWVLTRLAEMAERQGLVQDADQLYKQALKLGVTDQYLLGAYADFLLHQKRGAEVLVLLKDWESSDILLMRLAQAAQQTGDPRLQSFEKDLRDRFEAMSKRGEQLHEQEEARFLLFLENKPQLAFQKAMHNYSDKRQREPRDLEILLQAAAASQLHADTHPVIQQVHDWLRSTGFEDVRLNPWVEKTKAQSAKTQAAPTTGSRI
jgi:tetratricopeptide (TPR) repeat protein